MLWNTLHKIILFHHIQFQIFILTSTSNLKINATTTFQIICNLQRRMDQRNVNRYKQEFRSTRSASSPSGRRNDVRMVGPLRAQSQIAFNGGRMGQNYFQTSHMNGYDGDFNNQSYHNDFRNLQQICDTNLHFSSDPFTQFSSPIVCPQPTISRMCPTPSSSGYTTQFQNHYRDQNPGIPNLGHIRQTKKNSERTWKQIKSVNVSNQKFYFSVMSYNVLAQDLIQDHSYLYRYHNTEALQWHVRWVNILKELGDADPDIICFQEVQESHIEHYFSLLEKKLGYKSLFKKRTGFRTDGCAIYYKKKKLHLLEHQHVEYYQDNVPVLNRDNVAIVAKFVPKNVVAQPFVVATTHLLYNPKRQDVRLAQIQSLFTEVDKMSFVGTNENGKATYLPIILTGDMNASPNTAVYEFITKGKLEYKNLSKRSLTKEVGTEQTGKVLVPAYLKMTDNCQYEYMVKERNKAIKACNSNEFEKLNNGSDKNIKYSTGTLSHSFYLKSVYDHITNGDIEGTTHQDQWLTVDYIFYSGKLNRKKLTEDKLKLLARYQLLTEKQLNDIKIPNSKQGSDHFSLIAKFSLE